MSGKLHTPLFTPAQAAALLDQVIYEQVLEQAITLLATELDDVGPDRATDLARAMVDAALRRLPDDLRRYLDAGGPPFDGCPLCEEEAHTSRSGPGSSQRRASRGKA